MIMKVVFLANRPVCGGGERMFNMLMAEFAKRGHQVFLYSWNKEWENYNISFMCKVVILKHSPVGLIGKCKAFIEFRHQMQIDKPCCVIVFTLGLAEIAAFAAKSLAIPCICSERVDPSVLPASFIHRLLRKFTYASAAGIVFQTEKVKNYFPKNISKKGIVIPNPIMDDNLPQLSEEKMLRKEIVVISRLSKEKKIESLIDVFSEISNQILDYKMRIFGDGPLYDVLTHKIQILGMEKRIFLEGKVNRVVDYIKDSDIFILFSDNEGMPNALLESMAMGLACISTDFPSGGARVINNGENGLLIPVNDKLALKKALLNLIHDDIFKNKLKKNAVKIRISHSKENIIPLWINYVKSLIYR